MTSVNDLAFITRRAVADRLLDAPRDVGAHYGRSRLSGLTAFPQSVYWEKNGDYFFQLVLSWRWRCQSKGTIILCIAGFPTMFRLSDYDAAEIDRDILRCPCGARVTPLASSK